MLDHLFTRGELTQLEWVDLAARSLPVEGLVFDLRHFPRTDGEYIAELRKLCVDRALTLTALSVDDLFARDDEALEAPFAIARELGTPLILSEPPVLDADVPAYAWREAAQRGKHIARFAKRLNVTVAVRNAPGSLCQGGSELKRLAKEIDSSWIRFAPDPAALNADELATMRSRCVILTLRDLVIPPLDPERKGFCVLEARQTQLDVSAFTATIRAYARQWHLSLTAAALTPA